MKFDSLNRDGRLYILGGQSKKKGGELCTEGVLNFVYQECARTDLQPAPILGGNAACFRSGDKAVTVRSMGELFQDLEKNEAGHILVTKLCRVVFINKTAKQGNKIPAAIQDTQIGHIVSNSLPTLSMRAFEASFTLQKRLFNAPFGVTSAHFSENVNFIEKSTFFTLRRSNIENYWLTHRIRLIQPILPLGITSSSKEGLRDFRCSCLAF